MSSNTLENDTDLLLRLHQTLDSCSKSVEAGDISRSEKSISDLIDFLNPIAELAVENDASQSKAFEILTQIHHYLSLSSLNQEVIDALSFMLPKAVAKFACASKRCSEVAEAVIDRFIDTCNPRDMLSILCEALGSPSDIFRVPGYFSCLLIGTSKVLVSIKRSHFKQVKTAVPVILNVLKAMTLDTDDEYTDYQDLVYSTIRIAKSIHEICVKLEGEENKQTRALLSLFTLHTMALVTIGLSNNISICTLMVIQLTQFIRHGNLSYIGLITGHDVNTMTSIVLIDEGDDEMSCFSHVKHGSSLAVIWGYMLTEVSIAAEEDLIAVKDELQRDRIKRWEALGMLKHIFSSVNIPWELKTHAINFILDIYDGNLESEDTCHDYTIYMPSHYASLQAIEMVIMYSPDAGLRKNAFLTFKKVLSDIPPSLRFDVLTALIKNCDSSSMISILLHCIKEEMLLENSKKNLNESGQSKFFWNCEALELVKFVLNPPQGGPPDLPEYSDAVLSALNLFRFILITEKTCKSNYTGVLSKDVLRKVYNEWLLPLRTLVTGIMGETQKNDDELASDMLCALNPMELVLYRCIELVEENLKNLV